MGKKKSKRKQGKRHRGKHRTECDYCFDPKAVSERLGYRICVGCIRVGRVETAPVNQIECDGRRYSYGPFKLQSALEEAARIRASNR